MYSGLTQPRQRLCPLQHVLQTAEEVVQFGKPLPLRYDRLAHLILCLTRMRGQVAERVQAVSTRLSVPRWAHGWTLQHSGSFLLALRVLLEMAVLRFPATCEPCLSSVNDDAVMGLRGCQWLH